MKPILGLAVVHVVCGLAFTSFVDARIPSPEGAGYISLIFAQAGLIGYGVGFSRRWRSWWLLTGSLYFVPSCLFAFGHEAGILGMLLLITVGTVTAASLWAIRRGARITRLTEAAHPGTSDGLRFSIRDLFLITAAAAVMCAVGRLLHARVHERGASDFLAIAGVYGFCFAVVPLTSLWAALGAKLVLFRCAVVVGLGFLIGLIPTFYFQHESWLWTTVISLQAVIILASLLVLRKVGYRLVKNRASNSDSAADEKSAAPQVSAAPMAI
jgi:hypothetical protein